MTFEPEFLSLRGRQRPRLRRSLLESLECRLALSAATPEVLADDALEDDLAALLVDESMSGITYPGGVTVTDTTILTHTDVIPRFVAQPTITNLRSGSWSDPTMWSSGRIPTTGDRVSIAENTLVLYSVQRDAHLDGLEVSGSLVFSTTQSTRMVVGNLTVMPTGRLQIGSAAVPVSSQVTAELIFADQALDLEQDPQQFGTGLIAFGRVTVYGAGVDSTWLRLSAEPKAGDGYLDLGEVPRDWQTGDTLVLPDTRQVPSSQWDAFRRDEIAGQWETVVIKSIVGTRVFLEEPLGYDHLGARNSDGQLELLPHVAVLDRNVIIRSENPEGTRGHTLYAARSEVDVNYARFLDLGRTDALRPLDNTTFDGKGKVKRIGTNQVARYAIHTHHLMGPENNARLGGYQFRFVGNTIENSRKWAVAIHGSSFGLIEGNVVYNAQGAGFATEDGSEIQNVFKDNIAIRIQGTHVDGKEGTLEGDYGRGGSGFWFRRGGNIVVGNVAADTTYAGFVLDGYFTAEVRLPLFPGAMQFMPGQGVTVSVNPAAAFVNNEAYGMSRHGFWASFISGNHYAEPQPTTYVYNLRLWHIHHTAVLTYHTSDLVFDRLLVLGDLNALDRNNSGTLGVDLTTYENLDLAIRNSRIEGVYAAILAPTNDGSTAGVERPTVIENSTLNSFYNITVLPSRNARTSNGSVLEVRNVTFELMTDLPDGPVNRELVDDPVNIRMKIAGEFLEWTHTTIVRVHNYNRVAGDDFQVYFHEQSGTFVLPQTDPSLLAGRLEGSIGSPVAGLNNILNWAKYGIAMGGAVAPASATTREDVYGLVAPIADRSAIVPRVVLVTPWSGAVVQGNSPVRVRFNVNGLVPDGAQIYFRIDNDEPFTEIGDGGIFDLAPGQHRLQAYFGDENGVQLPGTQRAQSLFTVEL